VRTESTFTLKIACTASFTSVFVALGATWNTRVFWFFLDAEALLGNHWLADDLVCRFHQATSAAFFERVRGLRADFFGCLPSLSTACFWRRDAEFFSDNCSFSIAGCEKMARS
jgi:hypothetical protein